MNKYEIVFEPYSQKIIMPEGSTIKEAILNMGLDFDFPCGGRGACGKCRIKVLNKNLDPTEKEIKYLEKKELLEGIHLACELKITSNMTIELNSNKGSSYNILNQSFIRENFSIEPLINKKYIEVELPSLNNQKSDLKRLKEKLILINSNYKNLTIKFSTLQVLSNKLRQFNHHITTIISENEIIGIEEGDTSDILLGIAFDIGTTTIVAYLIDLNTGKELAVSSSINPQVKFGADVISRTTYANQNKNGIKLMQSTLLKVLDNLIEDTLEKSKMSKEDVYAITIVGNTCMHHLFLGLSPKYIAATPYIPTISESLCLDATTFNFHINPCGKVFVLPNIAGFVGADTVGVVLATEIDKSKDIKLVIDIGTNGEMVLGSSKKLLSCSTAAGPAFEGAEISSGMRGANGAIDHIYFKKGMTYSVIGNKKPEGIFGSGLLDALAGLVELGIINKRGRLLSPNELINTNAKAFENHIISQDGANAFLIANESETAHGRQIMITQDDITSLQLAKGAMAAGISILTKKCDINISDVKEVLLAGAFGNYMNPHSACVIGLIPKELEEKVKMVGNAAGTGSRLALLSRSEYNHCNDISDKINYIELGAEKSFNREFAKGMQF